jgi:hypothetical protein
MFERGSGVVENLMMLKVVYWRGGRIYIGWLK